jgi:peroxiredoxin Q/BCP
VKRRAKLVIGMGLGLALVGVASMKLFTPQKLLAVGTTPPDLSALDQHERPHRLSEERGRPVVVYFYPKDDTPGCTKQACTFRDTWSEFEKAGVQVLGVSGDGVRSKQKFSDKYHLPFPVLADPENEWAKAFGVRVVLGITSRVTFLLDKEGKVAKVYPDVDPALNVGEVLRDAKSLE